MVNGNTCSVRFTVPRINFRAMHYAVDHLDLDVVFPNSVGPVPSSYSSKVRKLLLWLHKVTFSSLFVLLCGD